MLLSFLYSMERKNQREENERYVDLHMHTFYSDGTDDPKSLVRASKLKGIEVMAITDHDILSGYFDALEEAKRWNIKLIPGVEISTDKYHILGLNVDPYDKVFEEFLEKVRHLQKDNSAKRIKILQKHGVPISLDKLERTFPKSRLGKYNVLMAMVQDPGCTDYFAKAHPGLSPDELFRIYLKNGGIAAKVPDKIEVDSKEAIEAIHKARGVAIIAHPFKNVDFMEELDKLRSYGLDGLEIQPNYGGRNDEFREYAVEHDLLLSYGSDFHGPSINRTLLGRGENLIDTERLLNRYKEILR